MKKIVKDSFVAISDFHSINWPYEKIINYYINEYDKIFILGDATDKGKDGLGTGGISLLIKIYNLCQKYPNRVFYVPGNHDNFLYGYAIFNSQIEKYMLELNHGKNTINDIDKLKRENPKLFKELFNWLGTNPLQRTHIFNGQRYAFAHAFFNKNIYKLDSNFSLKKYWNKDLSKEIQDKVMNIMWYRKNDPSFKYDKEDVADSEFKIVIGHTPTKSRIAVDLDLINEKNKKVNVYCVDGGIAVDSNMLKYDGGNYPRTTGVLSHYNTAPKTKINISKNIKSTNNKQRITLLKEFILNSLLQTLNKKEIIEFLVSYSTGSSSINSYNNYFSELKELGINRKFVYDVMIKYSELIKDSLDLKSDYMNYRKCVECYVDLTGYIHIYKSMFKKYNDENLVIDNLIAFARLKNLDFITNSIGRAREIAYAIGEDSLIKLIESNNLNNKKLIKNN